MTVTSQIQIGGMNSRTLLICHPHSPLMKTKRKCACMKLTTCKGYFLGLGMTAMFFFFEFSFSNPDRLTAVVK
uniref:Uncharacterized protein n=1 Tax=Anguilla anguilla TaxID=7936 RepID=A0A0E9VRR9_ANGAN